jgi:preprotein translocase subunit SecG
MIVDKISWFEIEIILVCIMIAIPLLMIVLLQRLEEYIGKIKDDLSRRNIFLGV